MEKLIFGKSFIELEKNESGARFSGGKVGDLTIGPSPIFRLRAKNINTKETVWLDSSTGWKGVFLSEDKITLRDNSAFEGLAVTINAIRDGDSLIIETEVENDSDLLSVMDVSYPVPTLSGNAFDLFYPQASGCVAENAGEKGLVYSSGYPYHHACMQYFAAYTANGGLYIGLEDPTASSKIFEVNAGKGKVEFSLWFCAPNGTRPKNSFKVSGVCRLKEFSGDWFEASKIYSEFVKEKCDWLPKLGRKGREDIPDRFRKIPFWVADFIPNTEYQRENKPMNLSAGSDIYSPDYWIEAVIELKNKLDVDVAYHTYNWHHIPFNIEYPHFLPAKDGYVQGAEKLRKAGIAILPYINAVSWEKRDAEMGYEINFENTGVHGAAIDEDGDILIAHYPQTTMSGHPSELVPTCPTFAPWQDFMANLTKKMNETLPIDGIYLDEISAHKSELCCNPEHDHTLYGGDFWVRGYREMMKRLNAEKPADRYYFSECNAEPYVSSFDGMLTWMWLHGDQVPAFSAVYGGYVQFIGRCTIGRKKEDFEFFKHSVAGCLHYGQVMGWCKADIVYSEKHMNFLKPYVKLREKYSEFFQNAEMQKPPRVKSDLPDKVTGPALFFKEDVVMPQVQASLWKSRENGQRVLFITNISEEKAAAKLTFDKTTFTFDLAPYECRAVEF